MQSTRLPYQGVSVSTEGQEHVPSVIGPMSRNVSSLIAVTEAIVNGKPWDQDPKCCPLPWRNDLFTSVQSRPMVIAVMRDDGVVKLHPPVARVLGECVAKLERAGHEIIPWTPGTLHQECIDIMVSRPIRTYCASLIRDTNPRVGSILYSRRWRGYSTRCGSWWRAFHPPCRSTCQ